MEAKELRIGNWYDCFGRPNQASWATIKDLENAPKNQLWCKPIPLTEEWLVRFGFKLEKSGWFVLKRGSKKTNDLKIFHFGNMYCDEKFNTKGGFSSGHMMIEYIHQLQNLYFALTGHELEYKE